MGQPEAPSCKEFNSLLASARQYRLIEFWEGSAHRRHPCGVIRRNIIFCNEWSTHEYCYAEVILDPLSKMKPWSKDPWGNGDPHPHPVSGGVLRVYDGRWLNGDGPWRQAIVDVLADLRSEIEFARRDEAEKASIKRAAFLDAQEQARVLAASAVLTA